MYVPILQGLDPLLFLRPSRFDIRGIVGGKSYPCRRGRDALWWGIRSLGIKCGENVLLPASLCGAILQPFLSCGISIKYYPLDRSLRYQVDEIEARIDGRTKAVYLIHYFGFPQDPVPLKAFCRDRGLWLIEDCALSLMGRANGELLGSYGSISIFSLRKFLPVPDGGYLRINDPELHPDMCGRTPGDPGALIRCLKVLARHYGMKGLLPMRLLSAMSPPAGDINDDQPEAEDERYDLRMSALSMAIVSRIALEEVVRARRRNFTFWVDRAPDLPGLTLLYPSLPDGIVPYSCPVLVQRKELLVEGLLREGIHLEAPVNAPFYRARNVLSVNERFDDVEYLSQHTVALPVHQSLGIPFLEEVFKRIKRLL
jgi:perosamine synthetase